MSLTAVNDFDPIITGTEEGRSHSRWPNLISHCNEDKDLSNRHSQVLQGLLGKLQMAPSDGPITVYVQQSGLDVIPYLSDLSFRARTYTPP